ncbi:ELM1/GtrOC1 family putative glycosyltransferase [Acetobacter farinalis]|uniref:ELM1/GtrOC1 family putative glycosyltransferase n=1 Tax=Acetobacter farinalis TaxID=1260984 RepID=UPI0023ED52B5|nr:ELM1/GtrOC1 family putative glycosyltransferase [Acetobacter farinalis]
MDTGRVGERAQCERVAEALGLPFRNVPLNPDFTAPARWPDTSGLRLILSFGNAVRAAQALRASCAVRPLVVQIGRPSHVPITDLDLIISLPQDDYPSGPNILKSAWPLNGASLQPLPVIPEEQRTAGTVVLYGAPSRQFYMGHTETQRLLRFATELARANGEPLHLIASPRTPPDLWDYLQAHAKTSGFSLYPFRREDNQFDRLLQTGSRFVVTADSASMLAEAWRTRAPVWLFPLPRRETGMTRAQRTLDALGLRPVRYTLVRRGVLGSGANFAHWHKTLIRGGEIRRADLPLSAEALRWRPSSHRPEEDLLRLRRSILALPGLQKERT